MMMMNILATIAQWEREVESERTREAMQFMKESLRLVGGVPYGFDLSEGQLEPNVEEIKTVKRVLAMKRQGKSYQKIAARLNADGVVSKNGGKWHPKTVMGVLRHLQSLPGDHWVIRKYFAEGVEVELDKEGKRD
jgi:site-specific DNA recombinase